MLIFALVVLNIPVYLFLGWLAFDSKENAARTFFETIVEILKCIFIPRIIRIFMNDERGGWSVWQTFGFLFACGAVVVGEYMLITQVLFPAP